VSSRRHRAVFFLHWGGGGGIPPGSRVANVATMKKQCPNCKVTLTRFQWSKLWWMSSMLSGRLVQPCAECGTLLRLSSMTLVTVIGAIGLLVTSVALVITKYSMLLIVALVCALVVLIGVMGARVETVPDPGEPVID
jgi:hypothetical protein